jgi:hypothetical protein
MHPGRYLDLTRESHCHCQKLKTVRQGAYAPVSVNLMGWPKPTNLEVFNCLRAWVAAASPLPFALRRRRRLAYQLDLICQVPQFLKEIEGF